MKRSIAVVLVLAVLGVGAFYARGLLSPEPPATPATTAAAPPPPIVDAATSGATLLDGLGQYHFEVSSSQPEVARWFDQGADARRRLQPRRRRTQLPCAPSTSIRAAPCAGGAWPSRSGRTSTLPMQPDDRRPGLAARCRSARPWLPRLSPRERPGSKPWPAATPNRTDGPHRSTRPAPTPWAALAQAIPTTWTRRRSRRGDDGHPALGLLGGRRRDAQGARGGDRLGAGTVLSRGPEPSGRAASLHSRGGSLHHPAAGRGGGGPAARADAPGRAHRAHAGPRIRASAAGTTRCWPTRSQSAPTTPTWRSAGRTRAACIRSATSRTTITSSGSPPAWRALPRSRVRRRPKPASAPAWPGSRAQAWLRRPAALLDDPLVRPRALRPLAGNHPQGRPGARPALRHRDLALRHRHGRLARAPGRSGNPPHRAAQAGEGSRAGQADGLGSLSAVERRAHRRAHALGRVLRRRRRLSQCDLCAARSAKRSRSRMRRPTTNRRPGIHRCATRWERSCWRRASRRKPRRATGRNWSAIPTTAGRCSGWRKACAQHRDEEAAEVDQRFATAAGAGRRRAWRRPVSSGAALPGRAAQGASSPPSARKRRRA